MKYAATVTHCSAEFFHGGYKKLWNVLVGKSLGQYFVAFLLHPTYFEFIAVTP